MKDILELEGLETDGEKASQIAASTEATKIHARYRAMGAQIFRLQAS